VSCCTMRACRSRVPRPSAAAPCAEWAAAARGVLAARRGASEDGLREAPLPDVGVFLVATVCVLSISV